MGFYHLLNRIARADSIVLAPWMNDGFKHVEQAYQLGRRVNIIER